MLIFEYDYDCYVKAIIEHFSCGKLNQLPIYGYDHAFLVPAGGAPAKPERGCYAFLQAPVRRLRNLKFRRRFF